MNKNIAIDNQKKVIFKKSFSFWGYPIHQGFDNRFQCSKMSYAEKKVAQGIPTAYYCRNYFLESRISPGSGLGAPVPETQTLKFLEYRIRVRIAIENPYSRNSSRNYFLEYRIRIYV